MVVVVAHNPAVGVKVYVVVAVLLKTGDQVPVMPLLEVVGKADSVLLEHIGATAVKVGVTFGLTTICIVAVVAHNPAVGVNVYVVVTVLFKAGDQVPVILLLAVVGKAASVAPEHIGATVVKLGVMLGLTTICIVAVVAHNPADGVKVYVVVAVLFKAGDQVPVMLLVDVVGKADRVPPAQIDAMAVKVGVVKEVQVANLKVVVPVPAVLLTATV
jgi:hypothetical protein